ncbi:MAG: iron transporter [Sporomusaceae bacterium]|nr:iron transporter [Sporomusaceae bacterium]
MRKRFLSMTFLALFAMAMSAAQCFAAGFQEYPIGEEQEVPEAKLKVAVVYFQPVPMEPAGMGLTPDKSDIHLETDIAAIEGNETGFGVGEWIPYLTVHYTLKKQGTDQVIEGNLMPMNASDGPHYGANVKMLGAGTYDVTFTIDSPERQNYMLHVDKETGVPGHFWDKPITLHWVFDYVPRSW